MNIKQLKIKGGIIMKNILYFIAGLILLPVIMVSRAVRFIRDLGMDSWDNYLYWRRLNKKLKDIES